ncbi:uncharacterized protein [Branchiostoma lanceolatum]|uniref:uncharacterized protein n=1 Tax=Branchiostoma lanceolatum TaxID=7740 RepID=UPI003455A9E9
MNYSCVNDTTDCNCSQSLNESDPQWIDPVYTDMTETARIAVTALYCVIFAAGVAGNILVCVVVWRCLDMRTTTNYFLVNLSVADLLFLLVCVPVGLLDTWIVYPWYLGETMCYLFPYVEQVVFQASILTIAAISVERYFAICRPLQAMYVLTRRRTCIVIALIWLLGLLLCSPVFTITVFKVSCLVRLVACLFGSRLGVVWNPSYSSSSTFAPLVASKTNMTLPSLKFIVGWRKVFKRLSRQPRRPTPSHNHMILLTTYHGLKEVGRPWSVLCDWDLTELQLRDGFLLSTFVIPAACHCDVLVMCKSASWVEEYRMNDCSPTYLVHDCRSVASTTPTVAYFTTITLLFLVFPLALLCGLYVSICRKLYDVPMTESRDCRSQRVKMKSRRQLQHVMFSLSLLPRPQVVHMLISVVALFFCPQVVHMLISVVALFFCPQVVHVLISVVALFFCPQVVHMLISVVALFFCPQVVHMLISVVALFFCPQVVHMLISVVALFFCPQVVHVLISVVALFFCRQVVHMLISVVALFFCPQVVHVLISVVALFFVCLTPHRVLQSWLLLTTQENINPDVLGACVVFIRTLVYLNSTLNPVLYTLVSCKFRSALVRTLSGRGRKRGSTISSTRFTARTSTIKSCQSRKETLQMTDLMLVLQSEPKPPEHKLVLRKVNSTPF